MIGFLSRVWTPKAADVTPNLAALPTAFDTARQNTTGRTLYVCVRVGIVSDPGENGHAYLESSPNGSTDWRIWDYVACRNHVGNVGAVGNGAGLSGFVPVGHYYRVRTATVAGFNAPSYVLDSPSWMTYAAIGG